MGVTVRQFWSRPVSLRTVAKALATTNGRALFQLTLVHKNRPRAYLQISFVSIVVIHVGAEGLFRQGPHAKL